MTKFTVAVAVGAAIGELFSPMVLDALNIESKPGFGMDDAVTIGLIVLAAVAARSML
jgi:hypothetical protein